jgi:hypothetical protein
VTELLDRQGAMPPDPHAAAWADLRRRRAIMWGLIAAWLPLGVMLAVVFRRALPLAIVALFVLTAAAAWRARAFRCPRCGKRFERGAGRGGTCRHCGVPMGTPKAG